MRVSAEESFARVNKGLPDVSDWERLISNVNFGLINFIFIQDQTQ